jgi:MFS family permease
MTEAEVLYCANHPTTETLLRCNKCGKPICMKCAKLTDVGYRCNDCIRSQQKVYFNAQSWDNPIAFVVSFLVALVATPIVSAVLAFSGFFGWIFAFIAGPSAGGLLSQIIRWSVGKRRGRYLSYFAIAGIILGMIIGPFVSSVLGIGGIRYLVFNFPVLVFAFLAASTAYRFLR